MRSDDRKRILIACIGNIFLGDDAFGVEVAKRLSQTQLPPGVRLVDFGIRGLELAYALADGYQAAILVDAAPRGNAPGTLYIMELDHDSAPAATLTNAHDLTPGKVLKLTASLGKPTERMVLVGCEPEPLKETEPMRMELSPPVRRAVDESIPLIVQLASRLLGEIGRDAASDADASGSLLEESP